MSDFEQTARLLGLDAGAPAATPASAASPARQSPPPVALSVAGVDPSGGAGVLADVKAFSALGAYGAAVVAALTAQSTQGVTGVSLVEPAFVRQQLDTLFDDLRVDAAKTGMLGTAPIVRAVVDGLAGPMDAGRLPHLVVDPVMVAKGGDPLLSDSAVGMVREALLPRATIVTPNLPEAGVLLGARAPETLREMRAAAERLRRLLADGERRWVLLKGGHLPDGAAGTGELVDLLHDGDRMIELRAPRIATRNTHGTGCTLSAAIAALLPRHAGADAASDGVVAAVQAARRWLGGAIAAADALAISRKPGSGHGPLDHFHAMRPAG